MVSRLVAPSLRRRDWNGALKAPGRAGSPGAPGTRDSPGLGGLLPAAGRLPGLRALALAGQGSRDLAAHALGESRHWAGRNGVRGGRGVRGFLLRGSAEAATPGGGSSPRPWTGAASPAHAARGTAPAPGGGRHAQLDPAWSALRQAPELAPWSPFGTALGGGRPRGP